MAKSHLQKHHTGLTVYGIDETIKALDKMEVNLNKVIPVVLTDAVQPVKDKMQKFIEDHKRTERTEESLTTKVTHIRGVRKWVIDIGFKKPAGIPALYLNIGTPFETPTYFIDNIMYQTSDEVTKRIDDALKSVIAGEWKKSFYTTRKPKI